MNKTSQFSTNKFNFQLGKDTKPYADENALITDSPKEVQSLLIGIYRESQKYNSRGQISDKESFEESLADMEISLGDMFSHSLINLGREIDNGQSIITKYRSSLENSQATLFDSNIQRLNMKRQIFFENYCNSLFEKKIMLSESINILDSQNQKNDLFGSNDKQNINLFLSMCNEQYEAIIRSSTRLYKINEKADLIQSKLRSYKIKSDNFQSDFSRRFKTTDSFTGADDQKQFNSTTEKLFADYKAHVEERKRFLEKRNTDKSLFSKNPEKKSGYSFGTGNRFSTGQPKANYGANNMFTSTFSKSNKAVASKPENSITLTPDSSSKKNDITPQIKQNSPSVGYTGFNPNGSGTPWAPKKSIDGFRPDPE